tara:strand:+ start:3422 stop:3682 length:261 start_codon:yes stop_codon:yes gene_type:complete
VSSKRKMQRQEKKKAEKELKHTLGLFDKIPEECLTCEEKFDKNDKKMVLEWQVIVRKEEKIVRLYCPDCWDKAIKIVKEYHEEGKK